MSVALLRKMEAIRKSFKHIVRILTYDEVNQIRETFAIEPDDWFMYQNRQFVLSYRDEEQEFIIFAY